jgi:aryl-alcohol dehydrogenase-like predicted oxidoreductase
MTTMMRKLGRSGIEVSAVGLGCWAIGGLFSWDGNPVGWGEVNDEESIRAIRRGLELGVNFLDTADVYGTGHSERVVARALEGRRQQVVIATKFGNLFDESTRQMGGADASPAYIRRACEASLKRLNTDYIDLYQLHLNGYDANKADEVRDALETLVTDGKIRGYGWSTDFVDGARVFAEGPNCTSIQLDLNVLADNAPMIALCEEHNLAAINRGPLGMGVLTGKYTAGSTLPDNDVRGKDSPEWMQYFRGGKPNPDWLRRLEAIRAILTSNGRTLAQGALAWLWARSPQTLPIPGFKTTAQVEDNAGAMAFGPLTTEQMGEIEAALVVKI